jgi:hypothetical protein
MIAPTCDALARVRRLGVPGNEQTNPLTGSAALKAGRYPAEQIAQAETQAADLVNCLKEIIKDMQAGDPKIGKLLSV